MRLTNPVCHKFERLINDEIAAGQQNEHVLIKGLRQQKLSPAGLRAMGAPSDASLTLYDVTKRSVDILSRLRFIYLASLIEAFGKEYISTRDNLPVENIGRHIGPEKSKWQRQNIGVIASTSLYNSRILAFVLESKYGIKLDPEISSVFWELGLPTTLHRA